MDWKSNHQTLKIRSLDTRSWSLRIRQKSYWDFVSFIPPFCLVTVVDSASVCRWSGRVPMCNVRSHRSGTKVTTSLLDIIDHTNPQGVWAQLFFYDVRDLQAAADKAWLKNGHFSTQYDCTKYQGRVRFTWHWRPSPDQQWSGQCRRASLA